MRSIEFETEIQNGMIKIPEEYLSQLQKEVRVILQPTELKEDKKQKRFSEFLSHTIQVDSMIIPSRDQMHER